MGGACDVAATAESSITWLRSTLLRTIDLFKMASDLVIKELLGLYFQLDCAPELVCSLLQQFGDEIPPGMPQLPSGIG